MDAADFSALKIIFDVVVVDAHAGKCLFRKDAEAIMSGVAKVELCNQRQQNFG